MRTSGPQPVPRHTRRILGYSQTARGGRRKSTARGRSEEPRPRGRGSPAIQFANDYGLDEADGSSDISAEAAADAAADGAPDGIVRVAVMSEQATRFGSVVDL